MFSVMAYQGGIIRRDLTRQTVLPVLDGSVKIGDIGLSADCSRACSFQVMAREILEEETARATAVDV